MGRRDEHLGLCAAIAGQATLPDIMVEAAIREGVAPLLGARPDADERLRHAHREELARGLVRQRAMRPLREALVAAGLPVLLLKGAALERSVYAPGERPMNDIDFLVPARRWDEALSIAVGVGARPIERPTRSLTRAHEYAVTLSLPPGVGVEIHRALTPAPLFAVDADALFARASTNDDGTLTPEPVDLFLILAIHAAKHGFALPFRAVVDGLRLAAAVPLAAAVLLDRATSFHARAALSGWVSLLKTFGLDPAFAGELLRSLGPATAATGRWLAHSAPWPDGTTGLARTARIAVSAEPLRAVGWLFWRSGLRLADLAVSGFRRYDAPHHLNNRPTAGH